MRISAGLALLILLAATPALADASPAGEVVLTVGGKVPKPLSLTSAVLAEMPRAEVRVKDHDGKETVYSGVALREILVRAGAPIGDHQLRGPNAALYVLAEAKDGYRVTFALAEADAELAERNILVADHKDGQALDEREGPVRLIVPEEKRQARWIRQLVSLRVEEPPKVAGDQRGPN